MSCERRRAAINLYTFYFAPVSTFAFASNKVAESAHRSYACFREETQVHFIFRRSSHKERWDAVNELRPKRRLAEQVSSLFGRLASPPPRWLPPAPTYAAASKSTPKAPHSGALHALSVYTHTDLYNALPAPLSRLRCFSLEHLGLISGLPHPALQALRIRITLHCLFPNYSS
ncbi:hypothetical protein HYPSUDRAFT_197833 [Hypholoma sublateritium FD-334 SS-4]|uniref:Uncharacterized protein n=1 Tax=Hypholoma sublateritium (strain FD-334 SS-4) TaxID=945553 RepID=A0A0D2PGG4_HYPSF|nr:hypothetical protein HYPSUDRAFT_197833 [Hypholoma sublateritium FD-334 SS-4]